MSVGHKLSIGSLGLGYRIFAADPTAHAVPNHTIHNHAAQKAGYSSQESPEAATALHSTRFFMEEFQGNNTLDAAAPRSAYVDLLLFMRDYRLDRGLIGVRFMPHGSRWEDANRGAGASSVR